MLSYRHIYVTLCHHPLRLSSRGVCPGTLFWTLFLQLAPFFRHSHFSTTSALCVDEMSPFFSFSSPPVSTFHGCVIFISRLQPNCRHIFFLSFSVGSIGLVTTASTQVCFKFISYACAPFCFTMNPKKNTIYSFSVFFAFFL